MDALRQRVPVTDKLLAFVFGVVFLSIILLIAIFIPNPTGFRYTIFRIVIALAAGGIGAVIPGFLNVSFRNVLRASGAVALFVVVYFFAPAAIRSEPQTVTPPPPASRAMPEARSWLQKVDGGQYVQAYNSMSKAFRQSYAAEEMGGLIKTERNALGSVISRALNSTQHAQNPPGQPPGHYLAYVFKTRFSKEKQPIFEMVQMYGENGAWKVAGFFTFVRAPSGQFVSYDPPDSPADQGQR